MPLDRAHVTRASRIMLPVHALFSLGLGLAWLLQSDARTAFPAYHVLRSVWSIRSTGGVVLAVGVILAIAVLFKHRGVAGFALTCGAVIYGLLGVAFGLAAFGGLVILWTVWFVATLVITVVTARALVLVLTRVWERVAVSLVAGIGTGCATFAYGMFMVHHAPQGLASLAAPLWPLYVAAAHLASAKSVIWREGA